MKTTGIVTGIISNLVTVKVDGPVAQNEICHVNLGDTRLMAEVIKVTGENAFVQVFESTRGLKETTQLNLRAYVEVYSVRDCSREIMMDYRTIWKQ